MTIFDRHHRSMMAVLLALLVLLSAGCALADRLRPSITTIQDSWTSTPTAIPDGFIFDTPTPTPTVPIAEPPPTTPTMVPTLQIVEAVYLPFEYGFMVYIQGRNCLYAYADGIIIPPDVARLPNGSYGYCLSFDELPEAPADAPIEPFGRVWSFYEAVPEALGAQAGDVVRYTATIPADEPVVMGGVFYGGVITLPDGLQLYCGTRAATAGSCNLR